MTPTQHIRLECTTCNETVYIAHASNPDELKYCPNCGEEGIEIYNEDESVVE